MLFESVNDLDRGWDARWDEAQRDEAVLRADQQACEAKCDLDGAIRDVERATRVYSEALLWTTTARAMRAGNHER